MSEFCQLWLTCSNRQEADLISKNLLNKHLVACVKQFSVTSTYWWKEKLEKSNEVLLLMESRLDLFKQTEKVVSELHSYDTFVLQATPMINLSKEAQTWLRKETNAK